LDGFNIVNGEILGASKKQILIHLMNANEFIALFGVGKEAKWLRNLLLDK